MAVEISSDAAVAATQLWPSKLGPFLREETIKVEAGLNHTQYSVHPSLLAKHSEYFKRALNGPWNEAESRVIKLDDVDCETFDIFIGWLYTSCFPAQNVFSLATDDDTVSQGAQNLATQLVLVKACEFGDRFQATEFMHVSESALVDCFIFSMPRYKAVIYAFKHLPQTSPVLQALVDSHCLFWDKSSDNETNGELQLRAELPYSFWMGVSLRYMQIQEGQRNEMKRCDYHRHGPERRGVMCKMPRIYSFDESDSDDSDYNDEDDNDDEDEADRDDSASDASD
ncbi:hypothetical protein E8E13_002140 [Curvularia kusanoi]|uniref:BTB domain-containing protein n=1 Tax=Curvularia kusanoi TaxID=90978 RepID=A0A9P4T9V6_CURKU|nr:hypothetical protein E8E13_002140 [Curvularia kusanoi]